MYHSSPLQTISCAHDDCTHFSSHRELRRALFPTQVGLGLFNFLDLRNTAVQAESLVGSGDRLMATNTAS